MKTYNGTTVKVIGVGGIGCNTISYIHEQKLKHVQLDACDFQGPVSDSGIADVLFLKGNEQEAYLTNADVETIQNTVLTKAEIVKAMLVEGNPEIVFIVAGMGGATGTGAAPEIARLAKELGLLTIGVVMAPKDSTIAEAGINAMKKHTDTTIVLSIDKLNQQKESSLRIDVSDQLNKYVATAVRAITEIVTVTAEVNVDVEDVRIVMAGAGRATVGSGTGAGEGRAMLAAHEAIATALLGNKIQGANRVLLSVISGPETELEMEELTEITEFIQNSTSEQAEIIFGHAIDEELGNQLRVTFIASTFSDN